MVIVKLDISNTFGSLCARLVLDVLSDKSSRDYACGIKVDEDFETDVHELRSYFDFFKFAHPCETDTNHVKCKTGGLQGHPPEFTVFPPAPFTSGVVILRNSLTFEVGSILMMTTSKDGFPKF